MDTKSIIANIGELEENSKFIIQCLINVILDRKNQPNLEFENDVQMLDCLFLYANKLKYYSTDNQLIIKHLLKVFEKTLDIPSELFEGAELPRSPIRVVLTCNPKKYNFENFTKEIIQTYNNRDKMDRTQLDFRLDIFKDALKKFEIMCDGCQCAICVACEVYVNKHMLNGYCAKYEPCCDPSFYCHYCNETALFRYYLEKI